MPHYRDPKPSWADPAQASVFDSPAKRGLRAVAGWLGGNDPASALAIGGPGLQLPIKGLAGAISDIAPGAQTLGELLPEYTPVGGEALYNIGRAPVLRMPNPLNESAFLRYASKPWSK